MGRVAGGFLLSAKGCLRISMKPWRWGRAAVHATRDAHPNYRVHQANLGSHSAGPRHAWATHRFDEAVDAIRAAMPSTARRRSRDDGRGARDTWVKLFETPPVPRPAGRTWRRPWLNCAKPTKGLESLGPDHPAAGAHPQSGRRFASGRPRRGGGGRLRRVVTVQSQGSPAAETHHVGARRTMYVRHRRRQDLSTIACSACGPPTRVVRRLALRMRADVAQLLRPRRPVRRRQEAGTRRVRPTVGECLEREDRTEALGRWLGPAGEVHYASYHHTGKP